jgi:hypothetical protein
MENEKSEARGAIRDVISVGAKRRNAGGFATNLPNL